MPSPSQRAAKMESLMKPRGVIPRVTMAKGPHPNGLPTVENISSNHVAVAKRAVPSGAPGSHREAPEVELPTCCLDGDTKHAHPAIVLGDTRRSVPRQPKDRPRPRPRPPFTASLDPASVQPPLAGQAKGTEVSLA